MNAKLILDFLRQVQQNNNRPWFLEHKADYEAARAEFEHGVAQMLERIVAFDASLENLQVKDCTYRFYRDTRFSPDKSPYKNHFGAYMSARGKKSLHGGYYIHLQPESCLVACGSYWLPTNILTSCRNEIMANTDEWLRCVENKDFQKFFADKFEPCTERESWEMKQGFGMEKLKTCPAGFPRDWEYVRYLRLKNYCCWHRVSEDFFEGDGWLKNCEKMFRAAKPMQDFINAVVDDYE